MEMDQRVREMDNGMGNEEKLDSIDVPVDDTPDDGDTQSLVYHLCSPSII